MTYTLVLTDDEMRVLRAALNIRVIQRMRRPNEAMVELSNRMNHTQPDREEQNALRP